MRGAIGGQFFVSLVALALGACADRARSSAEALADVVRNVGLPCDSVIATTALDSAETTWRVACTHAQTYLASVQAEGVVCVEPLPLGDALAPARRDEPPALCAGP